MIIRYGVHCSEPKVREKDVLTRIGHKDVLWLQVPVVDPQTVAVCGGVQNLQKGFAGQNIITYVSSLVGDATEKVSLRTIFEHHVDAVRVIHNFEHGDYVGMSRRCIVQLYLPGLEVTLSLVQRRSIGISFAERLDCIRGMGVGVQRQIYHTICPGAKNGREL